MHSTILQTHILGTFLAYFGKRYFLCIGLYSNKHFLHSYENNIDTVTSKGNCADKYICPMQQVNVCGPKLGHNSAVCVVTLLEPHSPDLITRGHYAYCKGGAL